MRRPGILMRSSTMWQVCLARLRSPSRFQKAPVGSVTPPSLGAMRPKRRQPTATRWSQTGSNRRPPACKAGQKPEVAVGGGERAFGAAPGPGVTEALPEP
jgi:hypothetical protein